MDNNLVIRKASLQDLEPVTALEAACFPPAEAADRESFRRRLKAYPDHFWLLLKDGVLVSMINGLTTDIPLLADEMFADAGYHHENGAWQMIFGVATRPGEQKKGYAAMVMRQVIEDAKKQGRKGLVLTCKEKLLHYYAKFGFQNEGISESEHGGAVWYDMRLTF